MLIRGQLLSRHCSEEMKMSESRPDCRTQMLLEWHKALEDTQALSQSPEAYTLKLIEMAAKAFTDRKITWADFRELKKKADLAQQSIIQPLE